MTVLAYKFTTESEVFDFDFSAVLGTGETIASATVTVTVQTGTDASPSAILSGAVALTTVGHVLQRVIGGTDKVTYRLTVTATTSVPNVYTLVADLPVYAPTSVV